MEASWDSVGIAFDSLGTHRTAINGKLDNADSTTLKNGIAATYAAKADTATWLATKTDIADMGSGDMMKAAFGDSLAGHYINDTTLWMATKTNLAAYESKTQMGLDTTAGRTYSGTLYQSKDADLTALAALDATAGTVRRTGAGAFSVTASDTVGLGTSLGGKQPLDADLTALAALDATAGTVRRTGAGAFSVTASDTVGLGALLWAKANTASPTFTGTVTFPTPFTLGAVSVLPTGTELNYVDGVTSPIQTQIQAARDSIDSVEARGVGTNWAAGEVLYAASADSSYSQTLAEAGIMAKATARSITYGGPLDTLLTTDTIQVSPRLTPARTITGISYDGPRSIFVKVRVEYVDSMFQTTGAVLVDTSTIIWQKTTKTSACAGGTFTIPDAKILRMVVITAGTPPSKGKSFSFSAWATEP
jgi:hypothetical protein